MPVVSVGYDGTVDEAQWAQLVVRVGASEYGVVGAGDFAASVTTGDRAVSIAAGVAWGQGVMDASDSGVTVLLDPVASGSRWDLICLRRDWRPPGGTTSIQVVKGGSTKQIPAERIWGDAGNQDDQPLWLIRVQAGSSAVQELVDLRCWGRNGGVYATDDLVRSYLGGLGGVVNVNGTIWQRIVGANAAPAWVRLVDPADSVDSDWVVRSPYGAWAGTGSYIRYRRRGPLTEFRARIVRAGGEIVVPNTGNIANYPFFKLPDEFDPYFTGVPLVSGGVGPVASGYIDKDGTAALSAVASGSRLPNGTTFILGGFFFND